MSPLPAFYECLFGRITPQKKKNTKKETQQCFQCKKSDFPRCSKRGLQFYHMAFSTMVIPIMQFSFRPGTTFGGFQALFQNYHNVFFCNKLLQLILAEITVTIPESASNGVSSTIDIFSLNALLNFRLLWVTACSLLDCRQSCNHDYKLRPFYLCRKNPTQISQDLKKLL